MSYQYRYDPDIRSFRIRFEGRIDMQEILRSDREIISEAESDALKWLLPRG